MSSPSASKKFKPESDPEPDQGNSTINKMNYKSPAVRPDNFFNESSTFQDRLEYMFENAIGTDVIFEVGVGENVETVLAHKLILGSASPVFHSMFFSDHTSLDVIPVPDSDPEAFKLFLRFLYNPCTPPDASVMIHKVSDLIYLARKYMYQPLETLCITFMQNHMNPEVVFAVLASADLFSLPKLTEICWSYIQDNTSLVLDTNLKTLELDMLCTILRNDFLNIGEIDLFRFVVRWAKNKSEKDGKEQTPENCRIVAQGAFNLIRYPTMSPHDIADHISPSNILSPNQIANIYNYISATLESERPVSEFNVKPRVWGKAKFIVAASESDTDAFTAARARRLSRSTRRARARQARLAANVENIVQQAEE